MRHPDIELSSSISKSICLMNQIIIQSLERPRLSQSLGFHSGLKMEKYDRVIALLPQWLKSKFFFSFFPLRIPLRGCSILKKNQKNVDLSKFETDSAASINYTGFRILAHYARDLNNKLVLIYIVLSTALETKKLNPTNISSVSFCSNFWKCCIPK